MTKRKTILFLTLHYVFINYTWVGILSRFWADLSTVCFEFEDELTQIGKSRDRLNHLDNSNSCRSHLAMFVPGSKVGSCTYIHLKTLYNLHWFSLSKKKHSLSNITPTAASLPLGLHFFYTFLFYPRKWRRTLIFLSTCSSSIFIVLNIH
jgi:hypothetical protein